MAGTAPMSPLRTTTLTLAVGALGAVLGLWLHFPVYMLTGPALLVGTLSLFGFRFAIAPPLWDVALLTIGVSVGARVTDEATDALLRWPLAFAALAAMLAGIMLTARMLLARVFGLQNRAAVLAATPGHLSLVLSLAAELRVDVVRISTIQSIRIMALTMAVPFTAQALGMDLVRVFSGPAVPMPVPQMLALGVVGLMAGIALKRLRIPAPMLIGGLLASTVSHVTGWTPGPLSPWIALPGFVVVGTMIGSRFSGTDLAGLRRDGMAGIAMTIVAMVFAALAAIPVSHFLDMPFLHVLVAFAPGGLETMVAMGVVMGANPGFLVASHVARLFILLLLLPFFLRREQPGTG